MSRLSIRDHNRYREGMTYVYPVVSRRARGVSVGVNLHPNNACNWRCVYCQVPGLIRGKGPLVDLERLRRELWLLLEDIVRSDFMERHVDPESRRLNDIAFSGNGEPTNSPDFPAALEIVAEALNEFELTKKIKVVLITNGSLVDRPSVAAALPRLAELGGEVWFKLDSATKEGLRSINSVTMDPDEHLRRLRRCAALCPTWIQTCAFAWEGQSRFGEQQAYLAAIRDLVSEKVPLRGVLLYGLARKSYQPEAPFLTQLGKEELEELGAKIRAAGLETRVSP